MSTFQDDQAFYTSLVIEHIVPSGRDSVFKVWYETFTDAVKQSAGFVRMDLCPPLICKDGVVKWYSIIHFDSAEYLHQWVESDDRKHLLASGKDIFCGYRFKSFTTGLEGWFSSHSSAEQVSLGPPIWKQILSVVLGLYPTVMIQSLLFAALGILKFLPSATAMLINLLITSAILSLAVMPLVARLFRFWLYPAYLPASLKTDLIGAGIIGMGLGLMALTFTAI